MALIILAHPLYADSIANKAVMESLQQSDLDLEIRDIHQLYPDQNINVLAEQQALLRHDVVIFQHPMYWFNVPSILKQWMDSVLSYQFAYGSEGDKLKGKKFLHSLTIGQDEQRMESKIESLLSPIRESINYIQMNYLGAFPLYDIATLTGNTPDEIIQKGQMHAQKIYNFMKNI